MANTTTTTTTTTSAKHSMYYPYMTGALKRQLMELATDLEKQGLLAPNAVWKVSSLCFLAIDKAETLTQEYMRD